MSEYTLSPGRSVRRLERLDLTGLLERYRSELERLASIVPQQAAWLDANADDALYEERRTIWMQRWEALRALRSLFGDRLAEMEVYAGRYLVMDIERGIYDPEQADRERMRLEAMRSWWDASPIRTMQQYDHPDYGPCPF